MLLCLKLGAEMPSEMLCFFKKIRCCCASLKKLDDKVWKEKIISVTFSYALFCLHLHMMIWLCWPLLQSDLFGAVQFGASHVNLRWPHLFKHQIQAKNLGLLSSKYSYWLLGKLLAVTAIQSIDNFSRLAGYHLPNCLVRQSIQPIRKRYCQNISSLHPHLEKTVQAV